MKTQNELMLEKLIELGYVQNICAAFMKVTGIEI